MEDIELARAAAQAAADVIRPHRLHSVTFKGEVDPVTNADAEAQDRILALITQHRPEDSILSEERGGTAGTRGRWWIIDPLDGTVNFVHGIPHVAVSVALYEEGVPVVGVVVDVFRNEEFSAVVGGGAWLNGRPLHVSRSDLDTAIAATGFPYDRRERAAELGATLAHVLSEVQGVRRMGTASLDLAWVAAGRFDVFWEIKLHPWDVAAGILLVREAGGAVTDRNGTPSTPFDSHFIASNGIVHEAFRELVSSAMP